VNRKTWLALSGILIAVSLLLSSCSGGLTSLFATSTPTNTSTPTVTVTPTATNTPVPPITLKPCLTLDDCAKPISLEKLFGDTVKADVVNNVDIPVEQEIKILIYWNAIDEETMAKTLPHVKWFFTIDGKDFFQESWIKDGSNEDDKDEAKAYPGKWFGVVLSGWKADEPHFVRYGYVLDASVNNGWKSYDSGQTVVYSWFIKPASLPTATLAPTITPTVKVLPTNTYNPIIPTKTRVAQVLPTATKGAPLKKDITIKVINKCSEKHLVVFDGPMHLKYNVEPGQTVEYQAPHGTYTWMVDQTEAGGPQDLFTAVWNLTLCR
jgi:hypothetical protein